jgi:hypothetical protein
MEKQKQLGRYIQAIHRQLNIIQHQTYYVKERKYGECDQYIKIRQRFLSFGPY